MPILEVPLWAVPLKWILGILLTFFVVFIFIAVNKRKENKWKNKLINSVDSNQQLSKEEKEKRKELIKLIE